MAWCLMLGGPIISYWLYAQDALPLWFCVTIGIVTLVVGAINFHNILGMRPEHEAVDVQT